MIINCYTKGIKWFNTGCFVRLVLGFFIILVASLKIQAVPSKSKDNYKVKISQEKEVRKRVSR